MKGRINGADLPFMNWLQNIRLRLLNLIRIEERNEYFVQKILPLVNFLPLSATLSYSEIYFRIVFLEFF